MPVTQLDEIDGICPGDCFFELVPDSDLNKQFKTNCYYKPTAKFSKELPEHIMAIEYSNALKECMQEAMKETFDLIDSEIPALSSVASNLFWQH
jgi:hypothetical protein